MRASRIFALARTMRCASVGAALRKACAISSVVRPLRERRAERLVQRLLGKVEVAQQPDQRGEYATRLGAIDRIDRTARNFLRIRGRRRLLRRGFHRPTRSGLRAHPIIGYEVSTSQL